MKTRVSKSKLETYFRCPALYYYTYLSGLPKYTDFPRLLGIAAHRFVKILQSYKGDDRPYHFKSPDSARSQWFGFYWTNVVNESLGRVHDFNEDKVDKYGKIGWYCIMNYWNIMEHNVKPLEVEKPYTYQLPSGIKLTGTPDQIRSITIEEIKKLRPELIVDGELIEGYLPVVIVDIKTGMVDYDPARVNQKDVIEHGKKILIQEIVSSCDVDVEILSNIITSLIDSKKIYLREINQGAPPDLNDPDIQREVIRLQTQLHLDIQPTMYTYLFDKKWDAKPIGFFLTNIFTGKSFFTYREERDYQDLMNQVSHFVDNVQAQSFPIRPGNHCRWSDYFRECRGDRPFLISTISSFPDGDRLITIQNEKEKENDEEEQLELGLVIPKKKRKKREPPELLEETPEVSKNVRILDDSD